MGLIYSFHVFNRIVLSSYHVLYCMVEGQDVSQEKLSILHKFYITQNIAKHFKK